MWWWRRCLLRCSYHKIPGDKCQHGFQPAGKKLVNLNLMCAEGDKHIVEQEMGITEEQVRAVISYILLLYWERRMTMRQGSRWLI